MWCDVTWWWCDAMSCKVMRIRVIWCDVMPPDDLSDVMRRAGMGCYAVVMRCGGAMSYIGCQVMRCDVMRLCDVVNWEMMCCEWRGPCHSKTADTSTPMRSATLGCKTQLDYEEPMPQYYDSILQSTSPYYKYYKVLLQKTINYAPGSTYYVLQSTTSYTYGVLLSHSCLLVITHETSTTVRGATSQRIYLRHSCLIVLAHAACTAARGRAKQPIGCKRQCNCDHTWNVQYSVRSNLLKKMLHNATTTFLLDRQKHPLQCA